MVYLWLRVRMCVCTINRVADRAGGGSRLGGGRSVEAVASRGPRHGRRHCGGGLVQAEARDQGQESVLHGGERAQLRTRVREARSGAHRSYAHLGGLEGVYSTGSV
jgi:hypothetical protein